MKKPKQYIIKPDPAGVSGGIEVVFDRSRGEVIVTGDALIEEIDPNRYVQIEFLGGPSDYPYKKLYTYIDPFGDLEVGDVVDVPTVYEDHNLAVVKKIGDGYKGKSKRFVTARFVKETSPQFGF